MKVEVVFKSKKNTKKIASIIGETLHTVPRELDGTKTIADADILYLGFGIYAGDVPKEVKSFVTTLDPTKVKKVVLFMTCASGEDQAEKLKETIRNQGLNLEERTFSCKGRMTFMVNKNQPNDVDLQNAATFATQTCPQV